MTKKLISIDRWLRPGDKAKMVTKIYQIKDAIIQELWVNKRKVMSTKSKRPYKLGQSCDGTIDTCVHALFIEYCHSKKLNPYELYHQAYPDSEKTYYNENIQQEILAEAFKQGVCILKHWGKKEFDGLIESLTEINNHSLVGVLLEKRDS